MASGGSSNSGKEFGKKAATETRLRKELMDLVMGSDQGISAFPMEDNILEWAATIEGPKETVYESLKFKLNLKFTTAYPYEPPEVKFISTCFHPNIDKHGNICLDILKTKWTASYDVRSVLLSIQSLLNEPNLDSPLDVQAADSWQTPEFKNKMLKLYQKGEKKIL